MQGIAITTSAGRAAHAQSRGLALVAVALFAMTLLGLAASMMISAVAADDHKRSLTASRRARWAAESGVHMVIATLDASQSQRDALIATGTLNGIVSGTVDSDRAVTYSVTISSGAGDALDNDLDGATDESDEAEVYELLSTGIADGVRRTIAATVRRSGDVLDPKAGLYFDDPGMEVEFENVAGSTVSGNDVDLAGNSTGVSVAGIGVNGDPMSIYSAWPSSGLNDVVGAGGAGSILQVDALEGADYLESLASSVASTELATTTLASPGIFNLRNTSYGWNDLAPTQQGLVGATDADDEEHFSLDPDVIASDITGFGVLFIDDKLNLKGATLHWNGLVVVRGGEEWEVHYGGVLRVTGALLFLGGNTEEAEFEGGTMHVQYSRAMIEAVCPVVPGRHVVLHWREAPSDD